MRVAPIQLLQEYLFCDLFGPQIVYSIDADNRVRLVQFPKISEAGMWRSAKENQTLRMETLKPHRFYPVCKFIMSVTSLAASFWPSFFKSAMSALGGAVMKNWWDSLLVSQPGKRLQEENGTLGKIPLLALNTLVNPTQLYQVYAVHKLAHGVHVAQVQHRLLRLVKHLPAPCLLKKR